MLLSRFLPAVLFFGIIFNLAFVNCYSAPQKQQVSKTGSAVDSNQKAADEEGDSDYSRIPDLKPGAWEPLFSLGSNLFPSVAISTATLNEGGWEDPLHIGDPWGTIGIAVCSPKPGCPVTVEVAGGAFINSTSFTAKLPEKGKIYRIFPHLKYNYEKLLSVKQTTPENLTFKVKIDDKAEPENVVRIQVRSINECVYYFVDYDGSTVDVSYFFAAYVNENHPVINEIMKEAVKSGRVDSFSGYSGDKDDVMKEIGAIWNTLKERGMHYSSITTTADDDNPDIGDQHVRLISESINYSQANCVDGSVLLASILRKIGLNVYLVVLPDHMFIAVDLDSEGNETICIETTMLGKESLEDAIEEGEKQYGENEKRFNSEKDEDRDYVIIDIKEARNMGIMPIKDLFLK